MVKHGIELDSPQVKEFCHKWKVKELTAFGSILRDDFGPDSDIDFLVEWEEDAPWDLVDQLDMQDELGSILERRIDLVSRFAIERSRNYLLRREIYSLTESVYAK